MKTYKFYHLDSSLETTVEGPYDCVILQRTDVYFVQYLLECPSTIGTVDTVGGCAINTMFCVVKIC
jgi:hypothetical protein